MSHFEQNSVHRITYEGALGHQYTKDIPAPSLEEALNVFRRVLPRRSRVKVLSAVTTDTKVHIYHE